MYAQIYHGNVIKLLDGAKSADLIDIDVEQNIKLSNEQSTGLNIALVDTAAGGEETQPYLYVLTYFAEQIGRVKFSSIAVCKHRGFTPLWQYLCNPSILSKIL